MRSRWSLLLPMILALAVLPAGGAVPAQAQPEVPGAADSSEAENPPAAPPVDALIQAYDAMLRSDHEEAVRLYEQTLDRGEESAGVHYNLGLAYAHLDRLPLAVFHLTQANFLDPGDPDISQNLALVKAEIRQRQSEPAVGDTLTKGEPPELFWLAFFHRLSRTQTEIILIASCWLAFFLLLLRRRMQPSGGRDVVLVLAVLSFLLLASAAAYRFGAEATRSSIVPGVVVAAEPVARRGPDAQAPRMVTRDLAGGSVVLILQERADWVEIALAEEETGWLPREEVRRIGLGSF